MAQLLHVPDAEGEVPQGIQNLHNADARGFRGWSGGGDENHTRVWKGWPQVHTCVLNVKGKVPQGIQDLHSAQVKGWSGMGD